MAFGLVGEREKQGELEVGIRTAKPQGLKPNFWSWLSARLKPCLSDHLTRKAVPFPITRSAKQCLSTFVSQQTFGGRLPLS
jgi:hypothetical protein